jgi:glycosyltransferase involved in cell wall biosynthesis
MFFGWREGRNPSPLFHTDFYLSAHPDVRAQGTNPLVHYVLHGEKEGRRPNRFFDPRFYSKSSRLPEVSGALAHYASNASHQSPSREFDAAYYARKYSLPQGINVLIHYFDYGEAAGYYIHPDQEPISKPGLDPTGPSQIDEIRNSGIFDAAFYRASYEDIRSSNTDPLTHYVQFGYREGRAPNLLFDTGFYLQQRPELRLGQDNILLHYLRQGWFEGVDPHLYFDTSWYVDKYNHLLKGKNPLSFFLTERAYRTSPSRKFDATAYARRYADVAQAGQNALAHYLQSGRQEGRAAFPVRDEHSDASRNTFGSITYLKKCAPLKGKVALFVTHSGNGRIKPYLRAYFAALRESDIAIFLVVAADLERLAVPSYILDQVDAVAVRKNAGYDFAAWAHTLSDNDWLYDCETLFLLNDSIIGPTDRHVFTALMKKIENMSASIVGLVDNYYHAYHISSFFFALKQSALRNMELHRFFRDVENLDDKDEVIQRYEVLFTTRMRAAGLKAAALFPGHFEGVQGRNRLIFDWEEMLDAGVPFVKASLIFGEDRDRGGKAVVESIKRRGFDIELLDPKLLPREHVQWFDLTPGAFHDNLRIAYIGPSNYANGLGVAGRGYISALFQSGYDYNIHPLQRPFHIHARITPNWQVRNFDGPPDVAFVHINGESYDALLSPEHRAIIKSARLRIAMFVWEADIVPLNWLKAVAEADAIWVPSEFCARMFAPLTPKPISVMPHVVQTIAEPALSNDQIRLLKERFRLPGDHKIILYVFDASSFLARKNPHALVRAFARFNVRNKGWQLVLKTKHLQGSEEGRELLSMIDKVPDITVIDRPVSDLELRHLFSLADIYASPHASEGFGLTIAEAMALGKVVVATDFGGSTDFLDKSCGFPVPAEHYTLPEDIGPYLRGSEWARIDESKLAEALASAAMAVEHNDAIGEAARQRVSERLSSAAVARRMALALKQLIPAGSVQEETSRC